MLTSNPLVSVQQEDTVTSDDGIFHSQERSPQFPITCSDAPLLNSASRLLPFQGDVEDNSDGDSEIGSDVGERMDELHRMAAVVKKKISRRLRPAEGTAVIPQRSTGALRRSAIPLFYGMRYEDPVVEAEFVVYFLAHRDIMISAAVVLVIVSVVAVFAVYLPNITSNALRLFCAAWTLWFGCGVMQFALKRSADKMLGELNEPESASTRRVADESEQTSTSASIFSSADALRSELRRNAFWCEFLAGGTQLGNLMFALGLSVAKSGCFGGATAQQRYTVCDSAIQLDGGYIILLWLNIFLLRMRFHLEAVFVMLTTTLFFLLRLTDGMPAVVPQYLGSFALIGAVESCACLAVVFVRETMERTHFEVYVMRQLKAVEVAAVKRDTERMMASQLPVAVVRSLHQSSVGLSGWGPHTVACVLAVAGFPQWCRKRGPCDAVNLLQRVANLFDSVRELFDTPLEKYHSLGDYYIVMSTAGDSGIGDTMENEHEQPSTVHATQERERLEHRLAQTLRFTLLCVSEADVKLLQKHNAAEYSDSRNVLLTPNQCVEPHCVPSHHSKSTVSAVDDMLAVCCSIDVGYGGGQLSRWTKNITPVGAVVEAAQERVRILAAVSRTADVDDRNASFSIVLSASALSWSKLSLTNTKTVSPIGWKTSLGMKEIALDSDTLQWLRQSIAMISMTSDDDPLAMLRADPTRGSPQEELCSGPRICLLTAPRNETHVEPRDSSTACSCNPLTQSGSTNARALIAPSLSNQSGDESLVADPLLSATEAPQAKPIESLFGEPSGANSTSTEKNPNAFAPHNIGTARLSSALFGRQQSVDSGTAERSGESSARPSIVAPSRGGWSGTTANIVSATGINMADDAEPTWSMDALEWDARQMLSAPSHLCEGEGDPFDTPPTKQSVRENVLEQFNASPIPFLWLPQFVVEDVESAYQLWSYGSLQVHLCYVSLGLQFASSASVTVICCVYNILEFHLRSSLLYSIVGSLLPLLGVAAFALNQQRSADGDKESAVLIPGEMRRRLTNGNIGMPANINGMFTSTTESFRVPKAIFSLVTVLQLIFFCAAVFLAPSGNVLSNGQIVWLYMAHGISFSRPQWYGPLTMWLLDTALCVAFVAQALMKTHETSQLKVMNIFLDVANVMYAAVGRVLAERSARESFQTEVEVLLLKEESAKDYLRLEKALRWMAPEGVAANVIAKVRADADKYLQQKLHPDRSTNFTTTTADVQFIVLQLRSESSASNAQRRSTTGSGNTAPHSLLDHDRDTSPLLVKGRSSAPLCATAINSSVSTRRNEVLVTSNSLRKRLHRGDGAVSDPSFQLPTSQISASTTNQNSFVASMKPVMDTVRVIVRLLKHFPHLRLVKSSGDTLLIACEPVKGTMVDGIPTDPMGETDADRACEVVQLATYLLAYLRSLQTSPTRGSHVPEFKMVLNTGPLIGAVIGRGKGISFEYFGGAMCEALAILKEVAPWGSVVATERLVLLQEIIKDEEMPVSLQPLRSAKDGIWSARRVAAEGIPTGFVVMKRLRFGDATRCMMRGFAPVAIQFPLDAAETAAHFAKLQSERQR